MELGVNCEKPRLLLIKYLKVQVDCNPFLSIYMFNHKKTKFQLSFVNLNERKFQVMFFYVFTTMILMSV